MLNKQKGRDKDQKKKMPEIRLKKGVLAITNDQQRLS